MDYTCILYRVSPLKLKIRHNTQRVNAKHYAVSMYSLRTLLLTVAILYFGWFRYLDPLRLQVALSKILDIESATVCGTKFMNYYEFMKLFTHELSGIAIIFIPDKEPEIPDSPVTNGHLATLWSTNHIWKKQTWKSRTLPMYFLVFDCD